LAVPGLFRPGYFGRLLFTVVALMLMPLTMQVYLIYQFIYGKLKITDPLLHIGIIVALFLVPTVIAAFAVARAVRAGLSDTHRVLSQLGDGRFDVSAAAQTADEFGEQAIHLNNVIHRLREMYDRIETMNQNLEATVKKRTKQLETSLEEVRTLKSQQDGDYYLTSHLLRPLSSEDCESETIQVQQLVRQKKKFRFRDQSGEIGGDLCTFHDLRLRNRDYLVFLNGDAMGKSIQGAGGAIVLGTVFKSIVARSAMIKSQGEKFPEQWLRDAFQELRTVFASFDGFMQASAVVGLMDQLTGFLYFFSADHPPLVLYREGKASFVPVDAQTMRLGVEGLGEGFHLSTFSLQPGDVILAGSDGRDDLVLSTSEDGIRQFNDDENAFLSRVEESGGDLNELLQRIQNTGEITDDLSLLRIAYRSDGAGTLSHPDLAAKLRESRTAYRQGDFGRAALLYEQLSDLEQSSTEHLFHASYCHKLDRSYTTACDYGERCRMRAPYYVRNLVNLADCHRLLGNRERCLEILEEATRLEPENPSILKLQSMLHRISSPAKI
ncbi:MAG: SpoIIE family protein phosphatase, partial [Leptospiraceae bacterium]|nr:SpoIIE family protein phosphatase [Leptospiraceae bacterium]